MSTNSLTYSKKIGSITFIVLVYALSIVAQTAQLRNRGESFYNLLNSNTTGDGDIWVRTTAVGSIWDDVPIRMDSVNNSVSKHTWFSNVRAFPEFTVQYGIKDFAMLTVESRIMTWAWVKPGWVALDCKLTYPNNKDLRLNGYAIDLKYNYNFTEEHPTLGGYLGFMPEGYFVKGSNIQGLFIYELDLLQLSSFLPLRILANVGARVPLNDTLYHNYQILGNAGVVYSGYGFDFFIAYNIEAFNNFFEPKVMAAEYRPFLVYFTENPMYVTFGGNIRYDNGLELSAAVPLLLSVNQQSKMTRDDLTELNRNLDPLKFADEKKRNIKNPFDPWFVQWKVAASITIPLRAKMTSAEMMRNFLIMKNRQQQKRIDIDKRMQLPSDIKETDETDRQRRLDEIKKRREQLQ